MIKINDYCFVSRWSDGDPNDPWGVGFISEITTTEHETLYRISNLERYFKHARKISHGEGTKIIMDKGDWRDE